MKRSVLVVVAAVFTWGILSWPCRAQLLGTAFTYQGELRAGGVPATGSYDLRFRLYDAATGGTQVGPLVCLDNVSVADGRFTVSLDFGAQFAGLQRFLEIEVRADTGLNCANPAGFTTLSPRQPLTGAPHALFALNAGQLNGQPSSFYLNAANLTSGTLADARLSSNVPRLNTAQTFVGVQTFSAAPSFTAAGAPFTVSSSTLVTNLNADLLDGLDSTAFLRSGVSAAGGDLSGTYPNPTVARLQTRPVSSTAPTSGQVLKWTGTMWAPADDGLTLPFSGSANATNAAAIQVINTATSGASDGIVGQSDSTSGYGVYGVATAASGSTSGVRGQSASTSGYGVYGDVTATSGFTYGVYGRSASTSGRGVFGLATATSGATYGGWFENASTSGTGVNGVATATSGFTSGGWFESTSEAGTGVLGVATATSGVTYGVFGRSASTSGHGVYGDVTATSGFTYGVYGRSASTDGTGVHGVATATSGSTYGGWFENASTDGTGVNGVATATSGSTYGVWGQSSSTEGRGVYGLANASSGTTYGVYGRSASTSGRGVFGLAAATTGGAYGVFGQSDSTGGRGVFGWATATSGFAYGVSGSSASASGCGVYGEATATSGTNYGVYGRTSSPGGYAGYFLGRGYFSENVGLGTTTPAARLDILGGTWDTEGTEGDLRIGSADHRLKFGIATSGGGAGHATIAAQGGANLLSLGAGSTLDAQRTLTVTGLGRVGIGTTAPSFKLHAVESGSTGRAVYGQATATSGTTYGGWFESTSTAGTGVRGRATAGSGTTYGVWGQSDSPASTAHGVYGQEPPGGAGHAVYANGTLAATGTKSFQIDHPLTPETHYLNHFCAEGPEPLNAYSGNVITDELGYATITLPDYFESINRDPTYHLTVVDDGEQHVFVLAKVVRKIKDNQFTIRTSAPNVEVSWRVEAVRHDRYVQQYGFRTVQEKEDEIKGKYLQPELYGKPRERGIHYRPDIERPAPGAPPREQPDLAVTPPAPGRP